MDLSRLKAYRNPDSNEWIYNLSVEKGFQREWIIDWEFDDILDLHCPVSHKKIFELTPDGLILMKCKICKAGCIFEFDWNCLRVLNGSIQEDIPLFKLGC